MAAHNRKAKDIGGAAGSTATLSTAAGQMLRSLGLEAVDPEHVFELQSKEGAGAFGRVFRACYKHEPTRLAALKVIPVALEAGQRGEDIESVRKEIQFLRECDHPNVVAFYGAYYKDGALWVAMEYCGGGSVGDVSRARRLREDEIAVIMRGALRGLAYLHSKKKIHRDIKGGNILLTTAGQVKIADFGVSAQLRDTMSRRGTFVGTPYWMSPEMIQDSDYDYKSDIWSLGITAIELADQKPPLFDEHPMRVLIQIPRNPPPQLKSPGAWSPLFARFLHFCLQKDPLERPTALECLDHAFIRAVDHIDRVFAAEVVVTPVTTVITATVTAASNRLQGARDDSSATVAVDESVPRVTACAVETASSAANDAAACNETASNDVAAVAAESVLGPTAPLADDVSSSSDVASPAQHAGAPMAASERGADGDTDDIAEDIARLDDDGDDDDGSSSDDNGDDGALAACDSSSEDENESESSMARSETFSFRQPAVGAPQSTPTNAKESLSMVSGDELLELSVSESVELPPDMKTRTLHATSKPSKALQMTAPSTSLQDAPGTAPAVPASTHQPSTELRLLPSASTSPRTEHAKKRSNEWTAEPPTIAAHATTNRLDASDMAPTQPLPSFTTASAATFTAPSPPPRAHAQFATVTATPKHIVSVSSSWQNPLADIATAAPSSSSRVSGLLSSLNLSLSSSTSTRMFTKLLHDEEQEHARRERSWLLEQRDGHGDSSDSVNSSRYATPRAGFAHVVAGDNDGGSSSDTTKQHSLHIAHTLSPRASASRSHHRHTRSSLTASTQFIGSAFRVAHGTNAAATTSSVDMRTGSDEHTSAERMALHRQFGVPLAHMRCLGASSSGTGTTTDNAATSFDRHVPALLHMLRHELVQRDGLCALRIYCTAPEHTDAVQRIKRAINSGGSVDDAHVRDPHVYASLLKQWLCELPERLLATLCLDDFATLTRLASGPSLSPSAAAADSSSSHDRDIARVLERLSQQQRAVFEWLLVHMLEVVASSAANKTSVQSVAAALAPGLVDCERVARHAALSTCDVTTRVAECLGALLTYKQQRAVHPCQGSSSTSRLASGSAVLAAAPSERSHIGSIRASRSVESRAYEPHTTASLLSAAAASGGGIASSGSQSLDAKIRRAVDILWRELTARDGVDSLDALLTASQARAQSFERYQHAVLTLITQFAKRHDDQRWAADALARVATGASISTLVVPSALHSIQRWLLAALSADAFAQLLECEWRTRAKLQRLSARFPMLRAGINDQNNNGGNAYGDGSGGCDALDPCEWGLLEAERIHGLIYENNAIATRLDERACNSNQDDDASASVSVLLLQDGAREFARIMRDVVSDSVSSSKSSTAELAEVAVTACGEREPAVANLLVALSQSAALAHLPLDESRDKLRALVQRALQTHRDVIINSL